LVRNGNPGTTSGFKPAVKESGGKKMMFVPKESPFGTAEGGGTFAEGWTRAWVTASQKKTVPPRGSPAGVGEVLLMGVCNAPGGKKNGGS